MSLKDFVLAGAEAHPLKTSDLDESNTDEFGTRLSDVLISIAKDYKKTHTRKVSVVRFCEAYMRFVNGTNKEMSKEFAESLLKRQEPLFPMQRLRVTLPVYLMDVPKSKAVGSVDMEHFMNFMVDHNITDNAKLISKGSGAFEVLVGDKFASKAYDLAEAIIWGRDTKSLKRSPKSASKGSPKRKSRKKLEAELEECLRSKRVA